MKKISFLVALLAIVQIAWGQRIAQAQQKFPSDPANVEEALDRTGQDVAEQLERLVAELDVNAERISQTLERWAADNAHELDSWSAKYAQQWESWGNRFEQKLNRLAKEQEGIWQQWSKDYEQSLNQWMSEQESDELSADQLGKFVEHNLEMLGKMPLGQMVDQVLEDGIGELENAPWNSLEELGSLAQKSLKQPLEEIGEILDQESDQRRAIQRGVHELGESLERLKDDPDRDVSEARDSGNLQSGPAMDPRIRALRKLRQREDATPAQRERIDEIIRTLRDADRLSKGSRDAPAIRPALDIPRGDQIKQRVEREKSRQEQTLQEFNDDLRRSSEASRTSDLKARELDGRNPKRVDGKNLDPNSKGNQTSGKDPANRAKREGRSPQNSSGPAPRNGSAKKSQSSEIDSELDLLRQELEKLRNEVKRLKLESGK